jgi:glycosyltransferase involved in cell wall biosynthesis
VFDKLWGESILRRASRLIAVSPQEEQDARIFDVKPERIRLLPNVIFPEDYSALPPRGTFRQKWKITEQKIVLFLGRLHWIKGADLLIRALTESSRSFVNVHAVIAGPDDGQERKLREMMVGTPLEKRTTFTGYLDHQEKLEALVDADLLTIPSRSEIFAITALEALMCGTPVLLSSACALSPVPGTNCGVFRFENENIGDLVIRLKNILSRPADRSAAGRDFVLREFCPGTVAEKAEMIYDEAIRLA